MTLNVSTEHTELQEGNLAEELSGKLASDPDEERLAHSVLENDEQVIKDGQLLSETLDYASGSFTPDLMFEQLVQNYKHAERLYGETIIREVTGHDLDYIGKNVNIKEFRDKLQEQIHNRFDQLEEQGLLDKDGKITDTGIHLASLILYTEELDHLQTQGLGKKEKKERTIYGEKDAIVQFKQHRYKDLDLKASIKLALRRGQKKIRKEDLRAAERKEHGAIEIVYALDTSGSMRGDKIHMSKKAGIALAFKAIQDRNDVGLVVFTDQVEQAIPPTSDFSLLLHTLTSVKASNETDLALAIRESVQLFSKKPGTKHLLLLTDCVPTSGEQPATDALEAVAIARDQGITISLVGMNLEHEGEKLAKKIAELGEGKLYTVKNNEELDTIILEDYERVKS